MISFRKPNYKLKIIKIYYKNNTKELFYIFIFKLHIILIQNK